MVIATVMVTTQSAGMAPKTESLVPAELREQMRPENIGHRMKLLRIAVEKKPSEMSDILGIERTYWSRFEGGKRSITDSVSALLVARFGVTLDFLILGKWEKLPLDLAEKMRDAERKLSSGELK